MAKNLKRKVCVIPYLGKRTTVYAGDIRLVLRGLPLTALQKKFGKPRDLIGDGIFGVAEWLWKDGATFGARFEIGSKTVLNLRFSFRKPLPARSTIECVLFPDGQYEIVKHGSGTFLENVQRGTLMTLDISMRRVSSVGFFTPHEAHAHDVCDCPGHETVRIPRA